MSIGHLVHVLLTVYNATEHVTQKSPGPMCGWVDRILHPDSCMSGSSWSKVPLWSIWFVTLPPWQPLPHSPSRWRGCLPRHGQWWSTCELYYSPSSGGSGFVYRLWTNPLLYGAPSSSGLPACFPNVRIGAVLARDPVDPLGFLLIFDLVRWMNQDIL